MNAELAITILLAVSVASTGLCLFLANLAIKELNEIINKMYRKVDNLQHNEMLLMERIQKLETPKKQPTPIDSFSQRLKEAINQFTESLNKIQINVVDKDKPLDFPNDRKD